MAEHAIHADDAGRRLDRYLRKILPRAQLGFVHKILREGKVRVEGARAKPGRLLTEGETLRIALPDALLAELASPRRRLDLSEAGTELDLRHEDAHLLAANKPAGLALHGGSAQGGDHLVARVLRRVGEGEAKSFRPAPAHRLDRPTSGLVLFGKTAAALRELTRALRENEVDKHYLALVEGVPDETGGCIELALREKASRGATPAVVADPAGKPARTRWSLLGAATSGRASFLGLGPETGRKHQLRAHLAAIGHPILGDERYGAAAPPPGVRVAKNRICLHAALLRLAHPVDGSPLEIEAPLPADLEAALAALDIEA